MSDMQETLGQRIRKARQLAGLTQGELGARLDPTVSAQAVQQWEEDATKPQGRQRYRQVAAVLGTDVDWLDEGKGEGPKAKTPGGGSVLPTDTDGGSPPDPPLNREDLRQLLEPLIKYLYDTGHTPPPAVFVDVLYAAYDDAVAEKAEGRTFDLATFSNVVSLALRTRR